MILKVLFSLLINAVGSLAILGSIFVIYVLVMSCYLVGIKYIFDSLIEYLLRKPLVIIINIATIINMHVPRIWIEILTDA